MQQRSIGISTLIIILCFLTIGIQFGSLYFLENQWISVLLGLVSVLFLSNFFLEISFSYETGFIISFILEIGCFLLIFLTNYTTLKEVFPYSNAMKYLAIINWLVPYLLFTIRSFHDRGPRFMGYYTYFIRTSILFWFIFSILWGYLLFSGSFHTPNAIPEGNSLNIIPFLTTSSYIEQYIFKKVPLAPILIYIAKYIGLFLPFGFYLSILLKRTSIFPRLLLIFFIPALVEMVQYFTGYGYCDIDDMIFGIFGMLMGALLYRLINYYSRKITDNEYLTPEDTSYFCMRKRF